MLNALTLIVVALPFRDTAASARGIAALLAFLWAWMGLAYHFAFFTAINPSWPAGGSRPGSAQWRWAPTRPGSADDYPSAR